MPPHGGDARLTQPMHTVAGGSALNTATHLSSLIKHFRMGPTNSEGTLTDQSHGNRTLVNLQTVINENDEYGRLIISHAREHRFTLINRRISSNPSCYYGTNEAMLHSGRAEKSTGHCAVIVSHGDRSFMTHLGCMEDFRGYDILTNTPDPQTSTHQHQHVHIAGYYNISGFWNGELSKKLVDMRNKQSNLTVSLVTQQDATNKWDGGLMDVLQYVDFLILSEVEAQNIVQYKCNIDAETDELAMIEFASKFFHKHSPETYIIVTRGSKGAVVLYGGKCVSSQATTRTIDKPVDATGAGDSFAAGFIYGLHSFWADGTEDNYGKVGMDAIKNGLGFGCANGTCCVMVQGASVPSSKRSIEQMLSG